MIYLLQPYKAKHTQGVYFNIHVVFSAIHPVAPPLALSIVRPDNARRNPPFPAATRCLVDGAEQETNFLTAPVVPLPCHAIIIAFMILAKSFTRLPTSDFMICAPRRLHLSITGPRTVLSTSV